MKNQDMTEVVAALIWDEDKFMICQRPSTKASALLWEFVGGKVEPGETKIQALIRECREELAITVAPDDVFFDVVHEYPDITVHLTLFNCTIAEGAPQLLEHNDLKWITPDETSNFDFCPADAEILKLIRVRSEEKKMDEIFEFLKACKTYYLATMEGDQPRVRPFGTIDKFGGKLYIQTGRKKSVSQQIHANPKIEICVFDGAQWLRVEATAISEDNFEAEKHMLAAYPELDGMYRPGDGNNEVFRLENVAATFSSFGKPSRAIRF